MIRRKKGKIKRKWIILLFCTGLVLILNSVGVGYSLWSSSINIDDHIESGNIEVVYDDCSIINEDSEKGIIKAQINGSNNSEEHGIGKNNRKLNIKIQKALPGYSTKINYTVKNIGTLPVNCVPASDVNGPVNIIIQPLEKIDPPPYKSLDNKLIVDKMLEPNCKSGIITITVGQIKESKNYNYSFKLVFNNNSWDDALDLSIMVEASDKFIADDNTGLIKNGKESTNAGRPNGEASNISTVKDTSDIGGNTGIIANKN